MKLTYATVSTTSPNGRRILDGEDLDDYCTPSLQHASVEALVEYRHSVGLLGGADLVIEYEVDTDPALATLEGAQLLRFRRIVGRIPAGPTTFAEALAAMERLDSR